MAKQKRYRISKGQNKKPAPMTKREKWMSVFMILLLCAGIGTNLYFTGKNSWDRTNDITVTEVHTDGEFTPSENYDITAWLPVDGVEGPTEMKQEDYDERYPNTVQVASRGNGGYPWEIVGYTVGEEDYGDAIIDPATDISYMVEIVRPVVIEAINSAWQGTNGSMNMDIGLIQLSDGSYGIEGIGDSSCVVVYQDPEDPENKYSEVVEAPFYYQARMFNGRPVVAWALVDYSSGRGMDWCKNVVYDTINTVRAYTRVEEQPSSEPAVSPSDLVLDPTQMPTIEEEHTHTEP